MLYVARKVGESIIIDNKIEIKLMEIKGRTAKIGIISAKDSSTIFRKEVYDRVEKENQAAQQVSQEYIKLLKEIR